MGWRWAVCHGKGQNQLGKLLMNLREDIRITNLIQESQRA